jgi:small nuclear ribonucleoprotein (snRNP)-like protein
VGRRQSKKKREKKKNVPASERQSHMTDAAAPGTRTPADFLKAIKGRPVVVRLNSGADYRGESTSKHLRRQRRRRQFSSFLTHVPSPSLHHLTGVLACLDGYMNIALENTEVRACVGVGRNKKSSTARSPPVSAQPTTSLSPSHPARPSISLSNNNDTQQEYVGGQLKNKYGDAFIRGNNGAREEGGWRKRRERLAHHHPTAPGWTEEHTHTSLHAHPSHTHTHTPPHTPVMYISTDRATG